MRRLLPRALRRARGDDGITLVELLVTMILMAVVSSVAFTAFLNTSLALRHDDNETRGLSDVKTVVERLSRDIREARGVVCDGAAWDPSCQSHLQLWVDYDSDYIQQPGEVVTWALRPVGPADPNHYNVIRTQNGSSVTEGHLLVNQIAFSYNVAPPNTELVSVSMQYDAKVGTVAPTHVVTFSTRLRNVS